MKAQIKQGLESIVNFGKDIFNAVKKHPVATAMVVGAGLAGNVEASENGVGYLDVINFVNEQNVNNSLAIINDNDYKPLATDGFDNITGYDYKQSTFSSGESSIVSIVDNKTLNQDVRLEESNAPFGTKLIYNGTLSGNKSNWINFKFIQFPGEPLYTFGPNENILFYSDRIPNGPEGLSVVDVRDVIAKNSGNLDLISLTAGNYTVDSPYGTGTLTIDNNHNIADLNEDGVVNMVDLAHMANDYEKDAQGRYLGDITSSNGAPDGYVDVNDIGKMADNWLWTSSDYGLQSKDMNGYAPTPVINNINKSGDLENNVQRTVALEGQYLKGFQQEAMAKFYGSNQKA